MVKRFSGFILYILITVLVVSLFLDRHESLERIERFVQDKLFTLRGDKNVPEDIVIIGIDDYSLGSIGEWPWDRYITAQLVDAVSAQDPRTIVLNLTYDDDEYQDAYGYTDSLANSLAKAGNVVLGYYYSQTEIPQPGSIIPDGVINHEYTSINNLRLFSRYPPLGASALNVPTSILADSAKAVGFLNLHTDADRTVRRQPLIIGYRGEFLPSIHVVAAASFMGVKQKDIHVEVSDAIAINNKRLITDERGQLVINYNGPEKTFKYYSASDVINKTISPRELTGKLVIISYTAFSATDVYATPVSRNLLSAEIMANTLENIIHSNLLKGISNQNMISLVAILLIGIFSAFIMPRISLINRIAVLFLFIVILANLGYVMFSAFNTSVKILYPALEITILLLISPLLSLPNARFGKNKIVEDEEIDYDELLSNTTPMSATQAWGDRTVNESVTQELTTPIMSPNATQLDGTAKFGGTDKTMVFASAPLDGGVAVATPMDHFGRYKLLETLGKGSMGMVYKGLDPAINRLVALKTIRLDQIIENDETAELKERLMREAQAVGKLSHPNIVTIYDVGQESSVQYIAMEYLDGRTLESVIASGPDWNYKTLTKVMIQVCDALHYAHENGIVHRDVKPANIMIDNNETVKVMDFGIARIDTSASMTQTGTALGTPNYISPEQLKGQSVDRRSDIFSVGVVFYELLTGEKPFKGDTLSALIYSILHTEPLAPSDVNPDVPRIFDKIVAKALVKDPDLRFQSARDLAGILKKLI